MRWTSSGSSGDAMSTRTKREPHRKARMRRRLLCTFCSGNLLVELSRELGMGMLLISHGLAIVRHVAHRVAAMYLGQVEETAPARELWDAPLHPYTGGAGRPGPWC